MPRITANGIRIDYELSGPPGAPVVTLSHSIATDSRMWEPQVEALAPHFRVLRFDTRGHGGTDAPPGPYSLEQLAEDANALLEALGIDQTHFVGLSMGGMIGQMLALTHPERLSSLTLCDTSARMPPEMRPEWDARIQTTLTAGMEAHVEPTITRWFTSGFIENRPDVVDSVRALIRETDVQGYVGCCRAIQELDLLDRLPEIRLPTLVIVGRDDPATPVEAARAIHRQIVGSQLVIVESASHLSNLEQPEAFNHALLAFLEKVG